MEQSYRLTPKQVAERLGVHVATLKRWVQAGELSVMKTPGGHWRFSETEVEAFAADHITTKAASA